MATTSPSPIVLSAATRVADMIDATPRNIGTHAQRRAEAAHIASAEENNYQNAAREAERNDSAYAGALVLPVSSDRERELRALPVPEFCAWARRQAEIAAAAVALIQGDEAALAVVAQEASRMERAHRTASEHAAALQRARDFPRSAKRAVSREEVFAANEAADRALQRWINAGRLYAAVLYAAGDPDAVDARQQVAVQEKMAEKWAAERAAHMHPATRAMLAGARGAVLGEQKHTPEIDR